MILKLTKSAIIYFFISLIITFTNAISHYAFPDYINGYMFLFKNAIFAFVVMVILIFILFGIDLYQKIRGNS